MTLPYKQIDTHPDLSPENIVRGFRKLWVLAHFTAEIESGTWKTFRSLLQICGPLENYGDRRRIRVYLSTHEQEPLAVDTS